MWNLYLPKKCNEFGVSCTKNVQLRSHLYIHRHEQWLNVIYLTGFLWYSKFARYGFVY